MRQKVLWDILMKLFMSLNKSSIHPSLNYLSKMNAPCISFHSSAFRAALKEELWNNPTQTMSIRQNMVLQPLWKNNLAFFFLFWGHWAPLTCVSCIKNLISLQLVLCVNLKYFKTAFHESASPLRQDLFHLNLLEVMSSVWIQLHLIRSNPQLILQKCFHCARCKTAADVNILQPIKKDKYCGN